MALLTQRAVAQTMVEREGDDVMVVKDNQTRLQPDSAGLLVLADPPRRPSQVAQTTESGHGRHEDRPLRVRSLAPDDSIWPGAQQVCRLERCRILRRMGEEERDIIYGLTSLAAEEASPAHLLRLVRAQWHIENKSPYVRDVTFDEDRSQGRMGALPRSWPPFERWRLASCAVQERPTSRRPPAGAPLALGPPSLSWASPENEMALRNS